jgi:hypothetical protein
MEGGWDAQLITIRDRFLADFMFQLRPEEGEALKWEAGIHPRSAQYGRACKSKFLCAAFGL